MPAITSRQNPLVARFRAVAKGEDSNLLLLDGVHLIAEAIGAGLTIHEAAVTSVHVGRPDIAHLVEQLQSVGAAVATVSSPVMQVLSPVPSASPMVAIGERPPAAGTRLYHDTPLAVLALDVQNPGNVGAIVRVAEAAGASGIVCAGSCADPFGWKALRGSMGSALRLPVLIHRDSRDAIDDARRHGCRIVAAAPRSGRSLFESDLRGPIAILVGGEGAGLSPSQIEAADERVSIPMQPPVESLNAAVSAALIMYEAYRQRHFRQGGHEG